MHGCINFWNINERQGDPPIAFRGPGTKLQSERGGGFSERVQGFLLLLCGGPKIPRDIFMGCKAILLERYLR